jgi:hypothetical protein
MACRNTSPDLCRNRHTGVPREHKLEIRLASKSRGKLIGGKRRVIY